MSDQDPAGQSPAEEPTGAPTGGGLPAYDAYAKNPPAYDPAAQNPYGQNPPAQNPYGQNPPAQNPYGQNPPAQNPYAQNPYGNPGYPTGPVPGSTSALAIVSMILGIVGVVGGFVFVALMPIAAIVAGFIARRRIRQFQQRGSGMALAGIITGFVGVAFFAAYILFVVVLVAGHHVTRTGY